MKASDGMIQNEYFKTRQKKTALRPTNWNMWGKNHVDQRNSS